MSPGAAARPSFRRFALYRARPPEEYRSGGYANAPDQVQLEGVVFSDGSVAVRWLTELRSTSIWPDFATFEAVHGHPEYESRVVWLDEPDAPLRQLAPVLSGGPGCVCSLVNGEWVVNPACVLHGAGV